MEGPVGQTRLLLVLELAIVCVVSKAWSRFLGSQLATVDACMVGQRAFVYLSSSKSESSSWSRSRFRFTT